MNDAAVTPAEGAVRSTSPRAQKARKFGYIAIGILAFAVMGMAIAQPLIFGLAPSPLAYGYVRPDAKGNPQEDKRGAFILLFPNQERRFPSEMVELLATTRPGVVDEAAGLHIYPNEIAQILIQTASVGEPGDYRIYRVGAQAPEPMKVIRQPGGKQVLMRRESGEWQPGNYIIDVPSEGMFGGRTFFQFYVDTLPTGGNS